MLERYKLTKQALKTLIQLAKDNPKIASSIKAVIMKLREGTYHNQDDADEFRLNAHFVQSLVFIMCVVKSCSAFWILACILGELSDKP